MRRILTPVLFVSLVSLTSTANAAPNGPRPEPGSAPALPAAARRSAPDTLEQALQERTTWLNLRYRHEHVSQDGFNNHANASTLRTLFGIETGPWNGMKVTLEVEDVTPFGPEDYNSTVNGNGNRPVVADPDHTEINQAYASFGRDENWNLKIGRQKIVLDNARFIGNVGWRQNMQTYDAASLSFSQPNGISVVYAYLDNVNRIFGDQHPAGDLRSNAHVVNISQEMQGVGKVSAYWYDLEIEDAQTLSNLTYGLRLDGKQEMKSGSSLLYQAEYAVQEDTGSNPNSLDQDYYHAALGWKQGSFTVLAAREFLGGSGTAGDAFITPLATLHAFNGFADIFLATPAAGLVDDYIKVSTKLGSWDASVIYHTFESDTGGVDLGEEWDAVVVYPYSDRTKLGVKFAHFDPESGVALPTTNKLMAWMTFKVL